MVIVVVAVVVAAVAAAFVVAVVAAAMMIVIAAAAVVAVVVVEHGVCFAHGADRAGELCVARVGAGLGDKLCRREVVEQLAAGRFVEDLDGGPHGGRARFGEQGAAGGSGRAGCRSRHGHATVPAPKPRHANTLDRQPEISEATPN